MITKIRKMTKVHWYKYKNLIYNFRNYKVLGAGMELIRKSDKECKHFLFLH
jgi:hypothetical protein